MVSGREEALFPNVPDWLTEKVRELRDTDRGRLYYRAAGWTIAWYLRKDIQARDVDDFFEPPGEAPTSGNDPLWQQHVNRAIDVAETLFQLRSSPGFEEQRKRLTTRPLRSTYFEMLAAKQFLKAGFQISARPEVGRLGDDFDFTATAGDVLVNVEVTALTGKQPSDATVLNALREKRRQLPTDAPAVVYCVIPENWQRQAPPNWDDFLQKIVSQFFRDTKRVNVVVFWMEEHIIIAGGRGAALTVVRKPYVNQNARHAMDVSLFFSGQRSEPLREALATADADGLRALEAASRNSEFFRWVDHLNPSASRRGAFTLACIMALLVIAMWFISAAGAEPSSSRSFYDRNGSFAGSSVTRGNATSFTDRNGRFDGTAIRNSDGTTSLYDRNGHFTGSVTNTTPRR
jgi:hypothetical protein